MDNVGRRIPPGTLGSMKRTPLPLMLGSSFSTKAALDAKVRPSRLRSLDIEHPFHAVNIVGAGAVGDAGSIFELMRWYALRMTEHEFFTHVTAAIAWDLPLPFGVDASRPLDVGVFAPRRNQAGRGVIGHSVKPGLACVVDHPTMGVRLTSPASTWAMLAGTLWDVYDVVAVGDAVVREPMHDNDTPALGTLEQLGAAISAGRRRGIARLREAQPRIRTRSDSRPETWLRLRIVDAGLDEPVANFDVWSVGEWIARVDLAYPRLKVAIEYEGEHHLTDAATWRADVARTERLIAAGWRVIRVTKDDVFQHPHRVTTLVRRAISVAQNR